MSDVPKFLVGVIAAKIPVTGTVWDGLDTFAFAPIVILTLTWVLSRLLTLVNLIWSVFQESITLFMNPQSFQ